MLYKTILVAALIQGLLGASEFKVGGRARVTRNTRRDGRTLVLVGQPVTVIQVEAYQVHVRDERRREFALPKDNLEPLPEPQDPLYIKDATGELVPRFRCPECRKAAER